jgi:hypothetical protein
MAIKFVLLVNKQGQTRVAQYYEYKVCHDTMPCCEPRKVRAAPVVHTRILAVRFLSSSPWPGSRVAAD